MRAALILALCLLAAAASASVASLPIVPPSARAVGTSRNQTRSNANTIMLELLRHLRNGNITAAGALLSEDASGMVTGYKCEILNKAGLVAVMGGFTNEVSVLGLISQFHIVSEWTGAFLVEDVAILKAAGAAHPHMAQQAAAAGPGWYFNLGQVLYIIQLTPDETQILRLFEFVPTDGPVNNATARANALFASVGAGNVSDVAAHLAANFSYTGWPQGQVYPQDHLNASELVVQLRLRASAQKKQARLPSGPTYGTCGNVAVAVSTELLWLEQGYEGGYSDQYSVNKYIDLLVLADTADASAWTVTEWHHFYWNQIADVNHNGGL